MLFVQNGKFNTTDVTALGPEATDLVDRMKQQGGTLVPLLPLIGRIDVVNFPNISTSSAPAGSSTPTSS